MLKFFEKKSPPKSIKNQFLETLNCPEPNKALWKTRDGHELLVSEMADSHLQNAHAMMVNQLKRWGCLELEMQKRGLPETLKSLPKVKYQPMKMVMLDHIYQAQDDMDWDGEMWTDAFEEH